MLMSFFFLVALSCLGLEKLMAGRMNPVYRKCRSKAVRSHFLELVASLYQLTPGNVENDWIIWIIQLPALGKAESSHKQ